MASTPGLDTQTPGVADPYLQDSTGAGVPTPAMGSTPAFADSSGVNIFQSSFTVAQCSLAALLSLHWLAKGALFELIHWIG